MDPATLSALMPLFEKLLDKILDLFSGATSKYENSDKTSEDLKTLAEDLTKIVKDPEFVKMAQKYVPGYEVKGDVDTVEEVDKLIDVFQQMINDPKVSVVDRIKLEGIVGELKEARADFAKGGSIGGENDLQVTRSAMPTSPGGSAPSYPAAPTRAVPLPLGTNDLPTAASA